MYQETYWSKFWFHINLNAIFKLFKTGAIKYSPCTRSGMLYTSTILLHMKKKLSAFALKKDSLDQRTYAYLPPITAFQWCSL